MRRWPWWIPLVLLVLAFGVIGLRIGWQAATITETDVINRYAAQYVESRGAPASLADCVATPGGDLPGIWIVVRCRGEGADIGANYYVNRLGGLEYEVPPARAIDQRPQT